MLAWKMLGEHATTIGNRRYEYLPQGRIMVHILDASGSDEVEGNCEIVELYEIFNILVQRKCAKLR